MIIESTQSNSEYRESFPRPFTRRSFFAAGSTIGAALLTATVVDAHRRVHSDRIVRR